MTRPAASKLLGLGSRSRALYGATERGELALYLVNGWPRVRFDEAMAWLQSCRSRPTAHAQDRLREVLQREGTGKA
jgi:hypothetical protein